MEKHSRNVRGSNRRVGRMHEKTDSGGVDQIPDPTITKEIATSKRRCGGGAISEAVPDNFLRDLFINLFWLVVPVADTFDVMMSANCIEQVR